MPDKYLRCLEAVKRKQTKKCQTGKQFGKKVDGKMCYNWYGICAPLRGKGKIHTGPRGGKYIMVKGKKRYLTSTKGPSK